MTSYRREVLRRLRYGNLPRFLELQAEKNALLAELGCEPYSVRCPAFGGLHHLVLEACFPSLAELERQAAVTAANARLKALDREQLELVEQGGAEDRLTKELLAPRPPR